MIAVRHITVVVACVVACVFLLAPAVALAQDYDLNFSLPTAGKSGCMVCHGDPNLGRLQGEQFVSYYVDSAPLDEGPHAGIMCTGCHLDFAYKSPHNIEQTDWVRTARLACKNCHQDQWTEYSNSVHSISVEPGEEISPDDAEKPLCGDCHAPAHEIDWLTDNPEGQAEMHQNGYEVCGRCHEDMWENYQDYYHGAAYQEGSLDAPACWDCHESHLILPSSDRGSSVRESQLPETCGQCHDDVNDRYASYAGLVHRRDDIRAENPMYEAIRGTQETIQGFFGQVRSWFT